MLKTLRMREFNNHLEEGIASLKAIADSKSQQLKHLSTSILQKYEHDGAIIHVGINDLIKNPNENKDAKKTARDVIDIALKCRILAHYLFPVLCIVPKLIMNCCAR